jgi:iron complex outermembrane recepter protein
MAKSRSLQQAVRFALAAVTAAAGVSTVYGQEAPPAQAQQNQPEAAPLQEVVVTGSRLQTPNATSISPITTVTATDIQATGLTRVEDILNNLPMVFAGQNATTSNGATGTATLDLRGLGNPRTLVLVDGLRLGPSGGLTAGANYSDINEIPAALISSVQILTGGASSVYGADAVAGVVNFILDTHFEGVRVDAGYNFFQHSQDNPNGVQQAVSAAGFTPAPDSVDTGFSKNASILVGSNFADNKGNATAYITYDNTGPVLEKSYDYSACSLTVSAGALACGGSGTSAKNGAGGEFLGYSTKGVKFLDNTVDGLTGVFRPFQTPNDLFNYGPYNYYQTPEIRWTAGSFVNYDVNSHATVYANVMFMRNEQLAQIAPSGDFGNPSFIPCADPLLNASESAVVCSAANQALEGNPYEVYNGKNYPGLNLYILRRNVEGGPRIADFTNESAREVIGVKGSINDEWTYDVSALHSEVDNQQQSLNFFSNSNIQQALNVLPGATGPVCGGPNNALGIGPLVTPGTAFSPNSSCVPWNIWTSKGVTPAQIAYLSVPEQLQVTTSEYDVLGSITGDLGKYGVKLPTADDGLQLNVGAEWREDYTVYSPDYVSEQGLAAGSGGATPPVSGEFSVSEAFTELRLPLAQHQPLAEDLAIEGGYRYSSYTLGFNTNTYKLGLEWAPTTDVRFRGSYQRAVRAPNIGELFLPPVKALDGSVDPCTGSSPAATLIECERSGVTMDQYGHLNPSPASQYNGLLGGNPSLEPEIADTYSVGFVLTPRVVPNLQMSVDYYDIKIRDVIETLGGNTIINGCVFQDEFCDLVHRDPNGSLWLTPLGYVIDTQINEGVLAERGFDVKGSYRQQLPALGSLLFGLEGTALRSLATTPVPGQGSYDCAGYYGDVCGGSDPKWRSVLNITWSTPWDALDLTLRWRYFGSQTTEQLNPSKYLAGISFFPPLAHIPAYNWFDLSATFNIYKNVRLQLGVNNIFDKDPPLVTLADCSTASPAGANCNGNTFPGVYDAMGRYLFAHITAQF